MARLVTSGFELYADSVGIVPSPGPDGANSVGNPGISRDTTVKRSGAASLKCSAPGGSALTDFGVVGVLDRSYFIRVYVLVTTLPSVTSAILLLQSGSTTVNIDTSGRLLCNVASGTTSAAINDGNWHRVEFLGKPSATSASRAFELRVDGATVSSGTGIDSAAYTFVRVAAGSGAVLNFDDLAVNDDQGVSQNSWPGGGSVALLVPTADSAVGTGWTNDNAATSSLFNSVRNTPPTGIADTTAGGGGHQIRNATSNANVNYDATMTTYTAAGIGASDTLNVVVPWTATGAPVTTSAKAGTIGVASNPAITNISLSTVATSGAFSAVNTAGTFPTNWKWSPGTATYAPSVTLGTAPVMRITQVTASTRIAMVCFMGMYVDYTPAAVAAAAIPDVGMALTVT